MEPSDVGLDFGPRTDFYPGLRRITGSIRSAMLYSCMLTMRPTDATADGWFSKSSDELTAETGLSYTEQVTARKALVQCGLLEERYIRLEHRMFFRIKGMTQ